MDMSPRCYPANTWRKSIDMKKGPNLRWSLIQCRVEQKLLTANTIYVNSVEIKLTRSWLAVITFCESPDNKS